MDLIEVSSFKKSAIFQTIFLFTSNRTCFENHLLVFRGRVSAGDDSRTADDKTVLADEVKHLTFLMEGISKNILVSIIQICEYS